MSLYNVESIVASVTGGGGRSRWVLFINITKDNQH